MPKDAARAKTNRTKIMLSRVRAEALPRLRTAKSTTIKASTTTWKPIQYLIGAPSSMINPSLRCLFLFCPSDLTAPHKSHRAPFCHHSERSRWISGAPLLRPHLFLGRTVDGCGGGSTHRRSLGFDGMIKQPLRGWTERHGHPSPLIQQLHRLQEDIAHDGEALGAQLIHSVLGGVPKRV